MKTRIPLTLALCVATVIHAAPEAPADEVTDKEIGRKPGGWSFSFLPKSFQKNPSLDMSVFTFMTEAGRAQPTPSPESPVYFISQVGDLQMLGDGPGGDKQPTPEALTAMVNKELAAQGMLPATPATPKPTLVLVIYCGTHYRMTEIDGEAPAIARARQLLERAKLVGGPELQKEFALRMDGRGRHHFMWETIDAVIEHTVNDLYFAVVSAYDFDAMQQKKRVLLWRTSMTVGAAGVQFKESVPTLIRTGGPYFGRETKELQLLASTIKRGEVEIGTATVVEPSAPPAPATPPTTAPAPTP